jgi:hypothetical protein
LEIILGIALALDVWAIVYVIGSAASTGAKVLWALLIISLPIVGPIIWFFARPERRGSVPGQRSHVAGLPQPSGMAKLSDVFISYASEDRERARVLAQALEAQGWSVWWDRTIPFGRRYDEIIANAIAGARCIIVLWSKTSIVSDWVREEAEQGRKRGILIPVLIENVEPPMGFRLFQTAELFAWNGKRTAPVFRKLLDDIAAVLGPPLAHAPEGESLSAS